jgi:histidinol dehydrogenase
MTRTFARPEKITFVKAAREDATADTAAIEATVKTILSDVREKGDAAVRSYAMTFDKTCPRRSGSQQGRTDAGP